MIAHDFPGKGKVAVLRTRPETVVDDYRPADGPGRLSGRRCHRTTKPS